MKAGLNAARACIALIAMSVSFSVAIAASPENKPPLLTLISTDTSEPFPFAAIALNHTIYHVTEGDVLAGISIRHISAGRVTLSDDEILTTAR
jgi:hypothetical protein